MLKTERNTPTMGARVKRAFRKFALQHGRPLGRTVTVAGGSIVTRPRYNSDFEHGQWWITDLDTGAEWSVCDAEGNASTDHLSGKFKREGDVFDGFCFEQVVPPEFRRLLKQENT